MSNNPLFGEEIEEHCLKCKLYKNCISPYMPVTGEGKEKILIFSEAPSKEEDEHNAHFVGSIADSLRKDVKFLDYNLDRDFWRSNAVSCKPKGKLPTDSQIKLCYNEVKENIKEIKPKAIIALGTSALKSLMNGRGKTSSINSLSGTMIPLPEFNCWMFPIFNPGYVAKFKYDENLKSEYQRILKNALRKCRDLPELPKFNMYKMIHHLEDPDEISVFIDEIIDNKLRTAVDFETSGLNPFVPGHKVFTVAITLEDYLTYTFPIDYPKAWNKTDGIFVKDCLKDYLEGSNPKIAHNGAYEMAWTKQVIKVFPNNFDWCTMVTQHLVDNRTGTTGLKHQAFVRWGIQEYDKEIKPFIKSVPGTHFNNIHKAPLPLLLLYNGMDSYLTMKLYQAQKKEVPNAWTQKFFNKAIYTFNKLSENGICVDEEYYKQQEKKLETEAMELIKEINNSKEVKSYKGEFDIASSTVLGDFLFNHLKIESTKETKTGKKSVDAEALSKIDHWIPEKIIKVRKLVKLKDTYLAQFKKNCIDGFVHPNFSLNIARSFRSSSSNPNIQNLPKRDKRAMNLIRGGIIPSLDKIASADFSGIEVTTSALYHKDPTFINYLLSDSSDMHLDNAADLWKLKAEEVTKVIRFYAKNCWTFPQFYGDYYASCAKSLWEHRKLQLESEKTLQEHLKENKIISYDAFEKHCQKIEKKLWYERFPVYTQWKKDINEFYQKNGYVETLMGFRFIGYMDKKQVANYPIQGCLQKNSLVQTIDGWIKIKELVDKEIEIWTGFKWAKATGVDRGECQLAKVLLSSGIEIKCDIRHEFKNEENKWIKFENLKKGDLIALPRLMERSESIFEMNWWFVLGFCIGDGWLGTRKDGSRPALNIYGGERKIDILCVIQNFLLQYAEKGFSKAKVRKSKDGTYCLSVEGIKLKNKLESFGYHCGLVAATKTIPEKVWTASEEEQMSFMEGLWLSDGTRNDYSLHMCNRKLLQEVQILLFGIGFDSSISKTKEGWKLYPQSIRTSTKIKKSTNHTFRKFPRKTFNDFVRGKNIKYCKSNNETITDRRAIAGKTDVNQNIAERIFDTLCPNKEIYRFDTVEKIEILNKYEHTYTMIVDDSLHQFVADGVICKNTAFHIMLWCLIKLNSMAIKEHWKSKFISEVHDSMETDIKSEEQSMVLRKIKKMCEKTVVERFDWITLPFNIEIELSKKNGNFSEMREIKWK